MNDQEKSDFLKARLLAEKGKKEKEIKDEPSLNDLKKVKDSLSSLTRFFSHAVFFIAAYFSQVFICERYSIAPFGFLESMIILYTGIKSITMVGRYFLAFKK